MQATKRKYNTEQRLRILYGKRNAPNGQVILCTKTIIAHLSRKFELVPQ